MWLALGGTFNHWKRPANGVIKVLKRSRRSIVVFPCAGRPPDDEAAAAAAEDEEETELEVIGSSIERKLVDNAVVQSSPSKLSSTIKIVSLSLLFFVVVRFVVAARAPDELVVADDELGAVGQTIGSENEDILPMTLHAN